nr:translation initiation factor IF-2-like [Equus asinus]
MSWMCRQCLRPCPIVPGVSALTTPPVFTTGGTCLFNPVQRMKTPKPKARERLNRSGNQSRWAVDPSGARASLRTGTEGARPRCPRRPGRGADAGRGPGRSATWALAGGWAAPGAPEAEEQGGRAEGAVGRAAPEPGGPGGAWEQTLRLRGRGRGRDRGARRAPRAKGGLEPAASTAAPAGRGRGECASRARERGGGGAERRGERASCARPGSLGGGRCR